MRSLDDLQFKCIFINNPDPNPNPDLNPDPSPDQKLRLTLDPKKIFCIHNTAFGIQEDTYKIYCRNMVKIGPSHPEIFRAEPDLTALKRKINKNFLKVLMSQFLFCLSFFQLMGA